MLDLHGWAALGDELNALSRSAREDKWEAMGGLIDDDVLHAFAVVAEPAGVAAQIRRRFGGLINRVSFYAPYESGTAGLGPHPSGPQVRPQVRDGPASRPVTRRDASLRGRTPTRADG